MCGFDYRVGSINLTGSGYDVRTCGSTYQSPIFKEINYAVQ
jgi:hypothetical protein